MDLLHVEFCTIDSLWVSTIIEIANAIPQMATYIVVSVLTLT
jgi:hypothetical protein